MEIINCDNEEIIKKVPSIENVLEKYFGDSDILLFACLNDNKLSFVGRRGLYCLYIDGDKIIPFGIKEDNTLNFYNKDNYSLFPNGYDDIQSDQVCCLDENGVIHSVVSYPYSSEDGYCNGAFSYFQYSSKTDTLCELRYRHYYNEKDGKSPIYGYYANKRMEAAYIDKNYSKKKFDHGIIPRDFHHYELVSFDSSMMGFNMVAISEHGLVDFFSKGSFVLIKDNIVYRYVKSFYQTKDGRNIEMMWPFCKFNKEENIIEEIQDLGFGLLVPEILLRLYNDEEKDRFLLEDLIKEMKKVIDSRDNEKYMLLRKKVQNGVS